MYLYQNIRYIPAYRFSHAVYLYFDTFETICGVGEKFEPKECAMQWSEIIFEEAFSGSAYS
jgi:hypothetical protein